MLHAEKVHRLNMNEKFLVWDKWLVVNQNSYLVFNAWQTIRISFFLAGSLLLMFCSDFIPNKKYYFTEQASWPDLNFGQKKLKDDISFKLSCVWLGAFILYELENRCVTKMFDFGFHQTQIRLTLLSWTRLSTTFNFSLVDIDVVYIRYQNVKLITFQYGANPLIVQGAKNE